MTQHLMAYFGHHKAGTTWISKIIDSICSKLQIKHIVFHSPKLFNLNLGKTVEQEKIIFFSYTNADINYVKSLDSFRAFHVIRDPRDIIVSAYFSHLYSHPTEGWSELVEQRERLKSLSKDEGLLMTIEFLKHLKVEKFELNLFESMYNWDYFLPNVMEIKFEDLIYKSDDKFIKIFKFLGIFDEFKIIEALREHDFSILSGGRSRGQEDLASHYRKGVPGDWKNHFKEEHIQTFKSNYNDLLVKLGYEKSTDW
jgi:hypothetical protein